MTINMIPCEAKNPCGVKLEPFAKGDGRDVNPNVKYYFLRVPEEIAKKEGFIPEVPEKASENELVNLEVINCIYKTSEVIKNYIDRELDHRDHGDHGRDYMYFVRLNSNTGDVQLNNIYTYKQDKKEGADPKLIPEFIPKLIPNVDSKHHLKKTMSG